MFKILIPLITLIFMSGCANNPTPEKKLPIYTKYYKALFDKCNIKEMSETFECEDKNITDNDLIMINFSQFTQIKNLNLSHNKLTRIPSGISNMAQLQELNLSYNNIQYPTTLLDNMFSLKKLDLSNNHMKIFNKDTIFGISLEELDLRYNDLDYLNPEVFKIDTVLIDKSVKTGV